MHILSAADLTENQIGEWFETAHDISACPKRWHGVLDAKLAGTLFFEPSTRTRWSTEAAMIRLGGDVLSMESAKDSSSNTKGESLTDTFKACSQYVDVLIVRHPTAGLIKEAASASDVPVINAGDGANEHPTQALLDLYTIRQLCKEPQGATIMFTGDLECSRTIRSLLKLLHPYKMNVISTGRNRYNVENELGSTSFCNEKEIYSNLSKVDILYMTRHQKERNKEREESQFVMSWGLAETMKKSALIMHPLPRNQELPTEVDNNPRAVYFKQAKNGMWVRMALLYHLLRPLAEK